MVCHKNALYLRMLLICFHSVCQSAAVIYGKYSGYIIDYEIIIPRKIKPSGSFHSFELEHSFDDGLRRRKRSTIDSDNVYYSLEFENIIYHLNLKPNPGFISPGMLVEHRRGNLSRNQLTAPTKHLCHYQGYIRGDNESRIAVSLCNGMVGYIKKNHTLYNIEPLEQSEKGAQLHVIYKRSSQQRSSCDASRDWWNSWAEELYRSIKQPQNDNIRKIRSNPSESVPRYIECCVVSDLKFILHHKSINIEEYVLSIMNMVADFYHDESVGNLIDLVVVRLVFLHKEKEEMDLDISPNATQTLDSFCKWQIGINPKDPSHPNHHDIAILLTRHDICSSETSSCGLLGLAFVGTACNPSKNCCINEDTGLTLAATVAHELGHNLGCAHDSPEESGCESILSDGSSTIMAPTVGATTTTWSNCSREFITNLLLNRLGECLLDEPKEQNYESPDMPIGAIYDADQQCKFIFGDDHINCVIGGDKICESLWCKKVGGKQCISRGESMADGTHCGPDQWCFNKECVPVGQRPPSVDGGWSDWGGWTQCTRSCGGGISMRQRLCTNPKPKQGGRFCVGHNREYKICNTTDCPENTPTFREAQCTEHNPKPFKGNLYTWTPYPPPESDPDPCALYCVNEDRNLVKLEPRVKDGTRCNPGNKNTCIHGACIHVGCDWGIQSGAVEDICGECNGDGTRCSIVKDTYNFTKGSGYTKVTTIPKGSTNIAVQEKNPCDNMLAIGSTNGTIYFNEEYTEKLPREYKLGGVFAIYTKPEKTREEIHIKGPLKEDIVLYYVFFKTENPGVEYKYSIPTSQPTFPGTYHWDYVEWGECSVKCGGGMQICKPTCVESKSGIVTDNYCDSKSRPEPKTKTCNLQKCRTRWKTWAWGPCSGCMYRTGERKRDVECVMELPSHTDGDEIIVPESECNGPKPVTKELCDSSKPCKTTINNCTLNRIRRWNNDNDLDDDFFEFSYNLTGVEDYVRRHFKRSTGHWLDTNCSSDMESVPIVQDNINPKDFIIKLVNLSDCNNELFSNMSETDFETLGNKVPIFSAGDPKIIRGNDAIRKFQEDTNQKVLPKPHNMNDESNTGIMNFTSHNLLDNHTSSSTSSTIGVTPVSFFPSTVNITESQMPCD